MHCRRKFLSWWTFRLGRGQVLSNIPGGGLFEDEGGAGVALAGSVSAGHGGG